MSIASSSSENSLSAKPMQNSVSASVLASIPKPRMVTKRMVQIVIQAISNGLALLNLSSPPRHMITGGVLAIAMIVDSLARQSRVSHPRTIEPRSRAANPLRAGRSADARAVSTDLTIVLGYSFSQQI